MRDTCFRRGGLLSPFFEELNRLIEAAVLYDRILLLGEYPFASGVLTEAFSQAGLLQRLTDADLRQVIADGETQQLFGSTMRGIFGASVSDAEDAQADVLLNLRISPNAFDRSSYTTIFDQVPDLELNGKFDVPGFKQWFTKNVYERRDRGVAGYFPASGRTVWGSVFISQALFLPLGNTPST